MILALIIPITFITVTLLGWITHKTFHQSWCAWFYQTHLNHHMVQYPATDFFSDTYRSGGRDSSVWLFIIAFSPILIGLGLLTVFGILSLTTGIASLLGLGLWGYLHDYIHDQFHLRDTWMLKLPTSLFRSWRKWHYIHHLDMSKNYGIIWFGWDKLFNTFIDENIDLN